MTQQTDAERLFRIRSVIELGGATELTEVAIKFLLSQLDAANQKIAEQSKVIEAVRNWRYGLIDKKFKDGNLAVTYPAIYRLATTFDVFEAFTGTEGRKANG